MRYCLHSKLAHLDRCSKAFFPHRRVRFVNSTYSNKKFIIDTNQAPRAIGPYSQGVTFGGLLFVSGQIPVDPQSGEIIQGGVEAQTRQVMNNLQAVLMAAGLDFSHVLKTTVFLRNMNDYSMMNDVYGLYFDYSPPARACVEVSRLPKDVLVEIECVAAAPTDYESRVTESIDTDGDHPSPDDWEQEHIADAQAAHEEIGDPESEGESEDDGSIAEDLADAVDAEPSEPDIDEEDELSALDRLDALQTGDDEEDAEVDEDEEVEEVEEEQADEEDELEADEELEDEEDNIEELDESEVIEDPLDVPSIPKLPGASDRPSPPRLAKLKLPKRGADDED